MADNYGGGLLGGFSAGLESGVRTGALLREQRLKERTAATEAIAEQEKRAREEQDKKYEQGIKLLGLAAEYRKYGPSFQETAMQLTQRAGNLLGMPMPDKMPSWNESFDEIGKEIELAIKGYEKFGDKATLNKALMSAYQKAGSVLEAEDLKNLREDVGTQVKDVAAEQQAGFLQQAAQIPGLVTGGGITDDGKPTGVISPEEAQRARIEALTRGGEKGQATLAKEMEPADEKDTATAAMREYEALFGMSPADRGSPEYREGYEAWLTKKARFAPGAGAGQIVVLQTAEGAVMVDKRTGAATPLDVAGKPLTGEMIAQIQREDEVGYAVKKVRRLLKPEYVGLVKGAIGRAGEYGVGPKISKEQAIFYAALQGLQNTITYMLSGKQISPQEAERLKNALPDRYVDADVFEARLENFEKLYDLMVRSREEFSGGWGKRKAEIVNKKSSLKEVSDFLKEHGGR